MSLISSIVLSSALLLCPDAGLRTYTSDEAAQRVPETSDVCPAGVMYAPLFGCKDGTGAAAVPVVDGATYSWSVEGASLVGGAGTPRITLAFREPGNVRLTCVVTTASCSSTASAVIGVRAPIDVASLTVPASATTGTPVTITWSYGGTTTPASQILTGDALDAPIALTAEQRSVTFTPKRTGSRTIELRASYAGALTVEPSRMGKRRSAGRSAASASDCAVVSAERVIDVKGCSTSIPLIVAPQEVEAGAEFQVSVPLLEGEESRWFADNGTIVVADDREGRAIIRANASGELVVSVSLVRGACSREGSRSVRVIPAAAQCSVSPTAVLTYLSQDCTRARVQAAFTGTPPFRGVWSDGAAFNTNSPALEHEFRTPGIYGITEFRDATCSGVVSGSPRVDSFRPRAALHVEGGSCANGTLVATLTGTPPFSFQWFGPSGPDAWVTTNEYQVRRPLQPLEYGDWRVDYVMDAMCAQQPDHSNTVRIRSIPFAEVTFPNVCSLSSFDEPAIPLIVHGPGPYTVTWSDGAVTQDSSAYMLRKVPFSTTPVREYTITRATSDGCEADLGVRTAYVRYRPPPRIKDAGFDPMLCPGDAGTATLTEAPPPGATIEWTVAGGEVISGQGTASITFRGTSVTDSMLRATAVYPDGSCSTFDHIAVRFHGIPNVTDFRVEPASIRAGQSTLLKFTKDENLNSSAIGVVPLARQQDLGGTSCLNGACTAVFTDKHGAGTVTFELQYGGDCTSGYKSLFTTLTIKE